jgi:hypothetical protein
MDPVPTPTYTHQLLVRVPLPTSRVTTTGTPAALCHLQKTRSSTLHATQTGAASCTIEPLTWSTWVANHPMQPHLMELLVPSCISVADPPVALYKATSYTFPQKTCCHWSSNRASALTPMACKMSAVSPQCRLCNLPILVQEDEVNNHDHPRFHKGPPLSVAESPSCVLEQPHCPVRMSGEPRWTRCLRTETLPTSQCFEARVLHYAILVKHVKPCWTQ